MGEKWTVAQEDMMETIRHGEHMRLVASWSVGTGSSFPLKVRANVQSAEQWRLRIDAHGSLFLPPHFFRYSRGLPVPEIS